jgi:hypothetical protein
MTKPRIKARPVAVFRLYPEENSRLYCRVTVWPTLSAMRAASTWERLGRSCRGFCSSVQRQRLTRGRWRTDPIFAEVHLAKDWLQTRIITHEFLHATFAFGRRIRFDWQRLDADDSVNAQEERLCYAHGELVSQFVDRAYKARLY